MIEKNTWKLNKYQNQTKTCQQKQVVVNSVITGAVEQKTRKTRNKKQEKSIEVTATGLEPRTTCLFKN